MNFDSIRTNDYREMVSRSPWAERVAFWQVDDDPEALALIEREVMGLFRPHTRRGKAPGK
jgi:hypothetical protein